ncbi:hypothetical protein IKJ53_07035 [bacterium]|nr:hypothetical protein [bacterium]
MSGVNATGKSYNAWTSSTSKNIAKKGEEFILSNNESNNFKVSSNPVGSEQYYGDFVNFTRSYIDEYDTNDDDAISFEEFVAKETAMAKEQGAEIPDESTLKKVFDRLNLVKDGVYADKLSEKEIYSYFIGLDSFDKLDGQISPKEFFAIAMSLQDPSDEPDGFGAQLTQYFNTIYNKIFG